MGHGQSILNARNTANFYPGYRNIDAYGNGDSGLYPGSTMKGCDVDPNTYGTLQPTRRLRQALDRDPQPNSYGNTLGYSGTAGNSTYVHDNKFYDNASGLTRTRSPPATRACRRSAASGAQRDLLEQQQRVRQDRQDYCPRTPFTQRKTTIVCPQFQTPVGTGA